MQYHRLYLTGHHSMQSSRKLGSCPAGLTLIRKSKTCQYTITYNSTPKKWWKLVPVRGKKGIFNIVGNAAGCHRTYLGASKRCGILEVRLYDSDEGTGLQQWKVKKALPKSP